MTKVYRRFRIRAIFLILVTGLFLGFRARAFSVALVCFGLAVVAPPGLRGFMSFMLAPPGIAVIALALVALGCTVEESGTLRRIRLGIGLRIAAVPILVFAVAWAIWIGAPLPSLALMGLVLGGAGAIGVGAALQHDLATYADVRYGQPVRLVDISRHGLDVESKGERVTLAISDIIAVRPVENLDGRAVIFLVNDEARRRNDLDALPWIGATPEGDAFVLTEHQIAMDAEQLAARLVFMMAGNRPESAP